MGRSTMVGIPDALVDSIRRWALQEPEVVRVWLFGSRAKGTHRIDSDVDLAVEILGWDSSDAATRANTVGSWELSRSEWQASLSKLTSLTIDLQRIATHGGIVMRAVTDAGVILYTRAG